MNLTEPEVQQPISSDAMVAVQEKLRLEAKLKNGAGWFFWIAGLSMINTVIVLFGSSWHFIFGLGITDIVGAIASNLGGIGQAAAVVVNAFIAGVLVLFGVFARKGARWAFIVGMVAYGLDGVLIGLFRDFLGLAFHAFALYGIYKGMAAISPLQAIKKSELAVTPVHDNAEALAASSK
ncbi:MAG TPA: hypothetical protein VD837_04315 [Terriglobales bacterium]|nr:hypothetical protein [Terriglobales bacterium]